MTPAEVFHSDILLALFSTLKQHKSAENFIRFLFRDIFANQVDLSSINQSSCEDRIRNTARSSMMTSFTTSDIEESESLASSFNLVYSDEAQPDILLQNKITNLVELLWDEFYLCHAKGEPKSKMQCCNKT